MKGQLKIPVAVKLSPYFTNLARFARSLDRHGANALVLFNRFYQPDIELETLEISPNLLLQHTHGDAFTDALDCPLYGASARTSPRPAGFIAPRCAQNAHGRRRCHDALPVLLQRGIDHIRVIEREMCEWLEEHEYDSVEQLKGSMSQMNCPDPSAFERAQYMRALSSYPSANT